MKTLTRLNISARLVTLFTIVSLLLSAFPVAFFVAEAQQGGQNGYFCHKIGTGDYIEKNLNAANGDGHYTHQDEGDIIPPEGPDGSLNWDSEGQAIHANGCDVPEENDSTDYCDPSQRPDGMSIADWLAAGGESGADCFEPIVVENQCGSLDVQLSENVEFDGIGDYSFHYVIGEETPSLENWEDGSELPVTFDEDEHGGSVDVTYYVTGPEGDYFMGSGIPNIWDGNGETVNVDTDCEEDEEVGTIEICKVYLDENGEVFNPASTGDASFTIPGIDQEEVSDPIGSGDPINDVTFNASDGLNTDLDGVEGDDAYCVTNDYELDQSYFYGSEEINGTDSDSWTFVQYNDQFNTKFDVNNPISDELGEKDDDNEIILTMNTSKPAGGDRIDRQIVVVNQYSETEPEVCSAEGEVISYTEPVYQNDDDPVDPDRRNASAIENGKASYTNFFGKEENNWQVNPLDFFSLGIEGELVYKFTNKVAVDQPGDDIAIWEITGGSASEQSDEKVEVYLSEDGVNYTNAGTVTGDGSVDISATGLDFVRYVKLVDDSAGVQNNDGDGYDVDAITIINESCSDFTEIVATKIICEDESLLPNGGYSDIDGNTAQDFLSQNGESCRLADEREFGFQMALGEVGSGDAPDNEVGLGEPWQSGVPTNGDGQSIITIPEELLDGESTISMRENLDSEWYLPFSGTNGSDETAELYCQTDAGNYDNLEWVKGVETGNSYNCVAWNVPLDRTTDVTMCKYDEEGEALPGWQLALLGEETASTSVPTDGSTETIAQVPTGSYVLKAEGTYEYRSNTGLLADARFSERQAGDPGYGSYPYQPWREAQASTGGLAVQVNDDLGALWGSTYSPSHTYYGALNQTSESDVDFYIYDNQYSDNVGEIDMTMYQGYTGVTGQDGCVTFEDVPYGDYEIEELTQVDWENVEGLGEVEVNEENHTFDVVNRDMSEVPTATLSASKIVCTDESELPNGYDGNIDENTAANWVAEHESCSFADDWEFEWATKHTENPDNTESPLYGAAGGDWNTFGPTVSGITTVELTEDDIAGSDYIWVREVLQEDYIPFTYAPDHKENDDDYTAEMYCHNDVANYDNYDRVDGISTDNEYHCVAWNHQEPEPLAQCTMVSDENTLVVENNEYATSTYVHDNWTDDIEGATWVWESYYVNDPATTTTLTFEETFVVNGVVDATIEVAADNGYKVLVNGELIVDRSDQGNNYSDHTVASPYDIASELNPGTNTVQVIVNNNGNDDNYLGNPAGALYRIEINAESECEVTTAPEPEDDPETFIIDGYKSDWSSEQGLEGWTIALISDGGPATTTTDENGYYSFEVEEGYYEVHEEMQEDWTQEDVYVTGGSTGTSEASLTYCEFGIHEEADASEYSCDFWNQEDQDEPPEVNTLSNPPMGTLIGGRRGDNDQEGMVAGISSDAEQCPFITKHMQINSTENDSFEVTKLQMFLNTFKDLFGGTENPVTGEFGRTTDANVKKFQEHFSEEILDPWFEQGIVPHNRPTGFVYKTTQWKINSIVCENTEDFPSLFGEDLNSNVDID